MTFLAIQNNDVASTLNVEKYKSCHYGWKDIMHKSTKMKYQIHHMILTTYADGANPAFIESLKLQLREAGYDTVTARYISEGLGDSSSQDIRIVPVNFKEHKAMLANYCINNTCR
jgi:hypothetical protein